MAAFVQSTATSKLGIKPLRELEPLFDGPDRVMVVYRDVITSFAKTHLQKLGSDVETFEIGELQFNIMRHCLVSCMHVVSPREVRALGLPVDALPGLLSSDPVARWHNWPRGTVVKVRKASPEGHEYFEYRTVRST